MRWWRRFLRLLLSIAAAVIVTRVSDTRDLAGQIGGQFADPRSWLPVGVVLAAVAMIPAMPQTIFLPAAAEPSGWRAYSRGVPPAPNRCRKSLRRPIRIDRIADVTDLTLVSLEFGYGLVRWWTRRHGSPLVARITGVRKQLSPATSALSFRNSGCATRSTWRRTTIASCWAA